MKLKNSLNTLFNPYRQLFIEHWSYLFTDWSKELKEFFYSRRNTGSKLTLRDYTSLLRRMEFAYTEPVTSDVAIAIESMAKFYSKLYSRLYKRTRGDTLGSELAFFEMVKNQLLPMKAKQITEFNLRVSSGYVEKMVNEKLDSSDSMDTAIVGLVALMDSLPEHSYIVGNTQTSNIVNATADATSKIGRLFNQKVWVAIGDERTRNTHAEADGQVVGIDEKFIVGGSELMFPSDPNGALEEIINCRCTMLPVLSSYTGDLDSWYNIVSQEIDGLESIGG